MATNNFYRTHLQSERKAFICLKNACSNQIERIISIRKKKEEEKGSRTGCVSFVSILTKTKKGEKWNEEKKLEKQKITSFNFLTQMKRITSCRQKKKQTRQSIKGVETGGKTQAFVFVMFAYIYANISFPHVKANSHRQHIHIHTLFFKQQKNIKQIKQDRDLLKRCFFLFFST